MPVAPQSLYGQLRKKGKQVSLKFSLKCSQALWRRHFWRQTVPSSCCSDRKRSVADRGQTSCQSRGTDNAKVDDERRRCRPGNPATGCKV